MSNPSLLRMTAPMREDFDVPYHDIGDQSRPPRIALVAGLHGDELNGVFVLSRLATFLQAVARGERPDQKLTGRVVIIPAVNILGLNMRTRHWPFDKTDINRMFPGYDAGETTQRIAQAVLTATRDAYYRVDIHSSNRDFEELPQVRLYQPNDDERSSAFLFGLPAVVERASDSLFTSTMGHAWQRTGGENFVIQVGQAGNLQLHHCETLFRGLVSFLHRNAILRGVELADEDEDIHYFSLRQTLPLLSEHAGFFVSKLDVGRWVQAGETIGHVYDSFSGEIQTEVRALVTGLLSGLRRQPLLCEGDLMARIQTLKEGERDADTYLHAQGQ